MKRAFGDGDWVASDGVAAIYRAWAESHDGAPPLTLRMVQYLQQTGRVTFRTDPGSDGWCRMAGPGSLYDGEPVTHVDSAIHVLDTYVAATHARKVESAAAMRLAKAAKRAAVVGCGWGYGGPGSPMEVAIVPVTPPDLLSVPPPSFGGDNLEDVEGMTMKQLDPKLRQFAQAHGFKTRTCSVCRGTGVGRLEGHDLNSKTGVEISDPCFNCGGDGCLWVRPGDMREYSDDELREMMAATEGLPPA